MNDTEPATLPELPRTGYIRIATLITFLQVSKSTIWRWVRDPNNSFPKPIRLSEKITVWSAESIHQWVKSKGTEQEAA